ncbi:Putative DNA-binding domain-containing protein [Roseovarius nanhaiticus]|uniref:Putative DNA-binding domain-containing protein n=1 Tax=Roseovarius nanhaiticus TaxID=573024 RepID=A0A1N7G0A6_9RHOB|nr:DNA-binding domain-containing protein [Roseovarius nanhaiticus]SEK40528.1 Putative DNA-binding domain-containing protein [Roseovarius nanhaiticus]SIS05999.1 Putative DNA-binding domain-containing protein [Roseovarius nanhaiticus]
MSVDQTAFRAALLDPERPTPHGLGDGRGGPAGRRFDVYRNNVASSLIDALELGFPALRELIGPNNFRAVMGVFLRQHPPRAPMIALYGADLPKFLESFAPLAHLGYLPDVARLEQALRECYHAKDAKALDPAKLQAIPPEHLPTCRAELAPALRILRSSWPVHAIWAYNMEPGAPKPGAAAQDVILTRPEFDPIMSVCGPGGAAFVLALAEGATVGAAHETATSEAQDFDLAAVLGILIGGGALTRIIPGDRP